MKIVIAILFVFSGFILSQAAPGWYVNPPRDVYPNQSYFMEVGASQRSYEQAVQTALGSIASQIRADVRSRSSMRRRSTSWSGTETIREDFSSSSMIYSDIELRNFDIAHQKKEGNTYFVLVIINKLNFITALRNDLKQINSNIKDHVQSANNNYNAGRVTDAVSLLLDINKLIWEAEEKIEIIGSIVELEESDKISVNTKELEDMIRNFVSSIKVEKLSGDNQEVHAGARLSPFKVRVLDENGNPLTRVQVGFYKDRDEPAIIYTDDNGEASFSLRAENTFGRDKRISAKVIFPFPSRLMRRLEEALTVNFSYIGTVGESAKFDVIVRTKNIPKESRDRLEKSLIDQLSKIGIEYQKGSARKIIADVKGVKEADIVSMGRMVRVSVHADIDVLRGTNSLGKFSYSSVGTGSDEARAFNTAAGNLRLKSDEIGGIIFDMQKSSSMPVIIVAGFEENNIYYNNIGNAFRNMLVSAMTATGEFDLVERTVLDKIFDEMQLSQTGMMDESKIVEVGKMVSGDYIVTGRISSVSSRIEVDVRMINIETGRVETTASETIRNTGELRFAANKIAEKLIK